MKQGEKEEEAIAIKRVPFYSINEKTIQPLLNEVSLLSSIKHQNVLSFFGFCFDPYLFICLEFANSKKKERKERWKERIINGNRRNFI